MNTSEVLNEVYCQFFDDDYINIKPEMTSKDIDGWDSLSHVNLIVAVESRFKMRFTQKEMLTFRNNGDLLRCVKSKIV